MFTQGQKSLIVMLSQPNEKQIRAILQTLSNEQITFLSEIAYNLLELPLDISLKDKLLRRKSLLKKLTLRRQSFKLRRELIKSNQKALIEIFKLVGPTLSVM